MNILKAIRKEFFSTVEERHKYCYVCGELCFWKTIRGSYDSRTGLPHYYEQWTCPKGHDMIMITRDSNGRRPVL